MKITAYVQAALSPVECAAGDGLVDRYGVITDNGSTWHPGCVPEATDRCAPGIVVPSNS